VFENIKSDDRRLEDVQKILLEIYKNKDNIQDIISYLNSNVDDKKEKKEDI